MLPSAQKSVSAYSVATVGQSRLPLVKTILASLAANSRGWSGAGTPGVHPRRRGSVGSTSRRQLSEEARLIMPLTARSNVGHPLALSQLAG